MSCISPEWCLYSNNPAFLRNDLHEMCTIPQDWALRTTNAASTWVEQQFLVHTGSRPLVDPPPELDIHTMLSCRQLAVRMAEAYQHPIKLDIDIIRYNEALAKHESGMNDAQEDALLMKFLPAKRIVLNTPSVVVDSGFRIILWYIADALSPWVQNDMYTTTLSMGDLFKKSITARKGSIWRIHESNFRPAKMLGLTPGCINIAPCWFQQGHECYGPPSNNPDDVFKPKVSATLKGKRSLSMIMAMQRPALLASAALRVMHPELYWASVATHLELGRWSADQGLRDMHRLLTHWASVYTSASIMCNCQLPDH
ncbi:hypothetical protein EV702DRAFT_1196167 [Suillus placidus]|uniref:Uncharacterized protein n=1 Tax=Suillus placidus TaxID=48579 RepID=A0A9P6ZXI9_9AGAM|nr:hypothetical protein EV702DRAFT_1196167 [Suillus placidus]